MAFNGSGTFNRVHNWVSDRDASVPITASRADAEDDGFATGLSTCITKDGQTTITANLPMAGFKHTGVGNAAARTDYLAAGQFQDGSTVFAVGAGTADAQTVSLSPTITAYTDGMELNFEAGATNTGAMTLNVSSVGAQSVVLQDGTDTPAGAVTSGNFYKVIYDLTNTNWVLINPSVLDSQTITSDNTTADVISVTADSLTTGSAINIDSDSSDTGTRNLVQIRNDNTAATNTRCLQIFQDAANTAVAIDTSGSSDGRCLFVFSGATTNDTIFIDADTNTSGNVINITADGLTTGKILNLVSTSTDTSARELVTIENTNTGAGSTTCLEIIDPGTQGTAISIESAGGAIDIESTTSSSNVITITSTVNTGRVIDITASSLVNGKILNLYSNSSSTTVRELVTIHNDNTAATSTTCLEVIQDTTNEAIIITVNNTGGGSSFVNFTGNSGANTTSPISTLTTSGSVQGHLRIQVAGTTRWIPFYSNPS